MLAFILCAGSAAADPGDMDTISARSAESLDSLQASLNRNKLGRVLSDYIFISRFGKEPFHYLSILFVIIDYHYLHINLSYLMSVLSALIKGEAIYPASMN